MMLFAYMVTVIVAMMLVWGALPVWADISVATLHNARENSFLLGCAISRFFGVYTYVVNLYLFLTINLLSVLPPYQV